MNKFIAIISLFLLASNLFSQGKIDGFYKGKNAGALVLGLGFEDPKNYNAGNTETDLGRSLYYVNLFGAYGLTDDLDVNANIPFLSSNQESSLQDISIMLKYRAISTKIGEGNLELSLATGFSTPILDYETNGLNALGQKATIIETRAMAHYSFSSGWFATLQSGYSFKFEETPNSIPATIKFGRASSNWYYDFYFDYQHSFGGIDYLGTPSPQDFREFGVDYSKIGGSVYKPFSENFGAYVALSYILGDRNTFLGPAYGLGLVYNY